MLLELKEYYWFILRKHVQCLGRTCNVLLCVRYDSRFCFSYVFFVCVCVSLDFLSFVFCLLVFGLVGLFLVLFSFGSPSLSSKERERRPGVQLVGRIWKKMREGKP